MVQNSKSHTYMTFNANREFCLYLYIILFEWYPQTAIDCRKVESNRMIQNQI